MALQVNSDRQQQTLQIEAGRRIHYPGDMANPSADGVVVAVNEELKQFDAILFDGRSLRRSSFCMLSGVRAWQLLDRVHGPAIINMAKRKAAERDAAIALQKTLAAHQLEANVAELIAANPHLTPCADRYDGNIVGKNIRALLKAQGIKASVRKDSASAYYITITTALSAERYAEIEAMCDRFQAGTFDGMTDCYRYERSAWTEAFGGVQHVFVKQERSA